jgi:hypothetical protein
MIAGAHLVLPYGFSDVGMRIATVRVDDLLARLTTDAQRGDQLDCRDESRGSSTEQ